MININIMNERTPKCHPEMAGEGVEYLWAILKNLHKSMKLSQKRGKENFLNTVNQVLSNEKITNKLICQLSRKARTHMSAYQSLDNAIVDSSNRSYDMIEKIVATYKKRHKVHRAVDTTETPFIKRCLDVMGKV